MFIHPDSITQLKETINITDIVSEYVVLKKRGQNQMGLCPFHQDKTPSFSINEDKQLYHCFGCGAGGDVIKFLQTINTESFQEVVLGLSERYNIELKGLDEEKTKKVAEQLSLEEKLREIMAIATNYYLQQLRQPENKPALDYLTQTRGLTTETIARFQLGYAPSGWDNLYQYLVNNRRYPAHLVLQCGLIIERDSGGYYDRFRDRVIFPIQDKQGRIIALGSRTFTGEEPKYLHSPETSLFNKSKVLYGLNLASKAIEIADKVIIVEGYLDLISLHQQGITYSVASLGTALTKDQVNSALKYTKSKTIILNFDGDAAGIKASEKGIETLGDLANSSHAQLKILTLPGNSDADEYLKANSLESYLELINRAPLWIEWLINQFIVNRSLAKPEDFQAIAKQMVKLLANLVDIDLQSYYMSYCAEILGQGNSLLVQDYLSRFTSRINKPISHTMAISSDFYPTPSLELLRLYIQEPNLREQIKTLVISTPVIFLGDEERKIWLCIKAIDGVILLDDIDISVSVKGYLLTSHGFGSADLDGVIRGSVASIRLEAIAAQKSYYLTRWQEELDPLIAKHFQQQWQNLLKNT
jgi:DNA primase